MPPACINVLAAQELFAARGTTNETKEQYLQCPIDTEALPQRRIAARLALPLFLGTLSYGAQ